nr:DUF6057 family protein [Maribellus comscasis]
MEWIKKNKVNFLTQTVKSGYAVFVLFFVLCFCYIFWFARSTLFFQEKQGLFIYSVEYLKDYLTKPGGLLKYAGNFFTQFYYTPLLGSIVLSATISLTTVLCSKISKRITTKVFIAIITIPAALLLLMQSHYYHFIEYNLGFLLVLFFFDWVILPKREVLKYVTLLLIPVFYYLAGSYLFYFLGMYIIHNLVFESKKFKFTLSFFAILISFFAVIFFYKIIFLQPLQQFFLYPLPLINVKNHKILLLVLTIYLVFFPVIFKLNSWVKPQKSSALLSFLSVTGVFVVTILMLIHLHNSQTSRILNLEHLVSEKKYDEAIRFHEMYPSKNLIGQYLHNISLSETDQLCERLFYAEQDFNVNSLILPWSNEHLAWGAHFFYSVGLINEAHRWAYEEMIVYGIRPQNIELLLKTNIIRGNYERAKKYNQILYATLNYRNLAEEYKPVLEDSLQIIKYPELISKRRMAPQNNFFIQINDPQNNIPLLLQSNSKNKKAFEYEMAWLLLSKDVETLVNNLKQMKELEYLTIPRHLEEAVLIYYNGTRKMPDLGGLSIRTETINNFDRYVTAFKNARNGSVRTKQNLEKDFGNTFMYYFHFR